MSSTEQAPEPTMDEILASIRKIISDDEPHESSQPEAVAPQAAAPVGGGFAGESAEAPDQPEALDDILDLTQIIEPQAPAAQAAPFHADVPQSGAPQGDTMYAAPVAPEHASPAPQAASGESAVEPDIAALLAEAGVENTVGASPPAADAAMETPGAAARPTAEEASITEALSAMDLPAAEPVSHAGSDASMSEDEPGMEPGGAAQDDGADDVFAMPMAVPEAEAAGALDDEPEMAAGDTSGFGGMTAEAPPVTLPEEPSIEPEILTEEEPSEEEPATAAPREAEGLDASIGAAAAPNGEVKTFEDSIKEMLRPLLREWLDDNMERIVHDAVKDEVDAGGFKGGN